LKNRKNIESESDHEVNISGTAQKKRITIETLFLKKLSNDIFFDELQNDIVLAEDFVDLFHDVFWLFVSPARPTADLIQLDLSQTSQK
jgi:hypothetical protein